MDYLLFDTYVAKSNQALQVTLVDKSGATWTDYTSSLAMPSSNQWERVFVDMTDATIDTTAIIEIRIGANYPGTYYFDNIFFAQSYADPLPDETEQMMQEDMGEQGQIIDWVDIPEGSDMQTSSSSILKNDHKIVFFAVIAILVVVTGAITVLMIRRRKRKEK